MNQVTTEDWLLRLLDHEHFIPVAGRADETVGLPKAGVRRLPTKSRAPGLPLLREHLCHGSIDSATLFNSPPRRSFGAPSGKVVVATTNPKHS